MVQPRAPQTAPGTQTDFGQKIFIFSIFCQKVDSFEERRLPELVSNESIIKIFTCHLGRFLRRVRGVRNPENTALVERGMLIRVRLLENFRRHLYLS